MGLLGFALELFRLAWAGLGLLWIAWVLDDSSKFARSNAWVSFGLLWFSWDCLGLFVLMRACLGLLWLAWVCLGLLRVPSVCSA